MAFGEQKAVISLRRETIVLMLLSRINRKSYMRFQLVLKSTILDDLEGSLCTLFQNTCAMTLLFSFSFRFNLLLGNK